MARTIDNLGVEISSDYAARKEAFDESLIKDSRGIQSNTKIDVTAPFMPSEFDTLFGLSEQRIFWPAVQAPPHFYTSRRRLFKEQLVPGIGSLEQQENQIERVRGFGDYAASRIEDPKQLEEIHKEKNLLVQFLEKIHKADAELFEINSRRGQYQKG